MVGIADLDQVVVVCKPLDDLRSGVLGHRDDEAAGTFEQQIEEPEGVEAVVDEQQVAFAQLRDQPFEHRALVGVGFANDPRQGYSGQHGEKAAELHTDGPESAGASMRAELPEQFWPLGQIQRDLVSGLEGVALPLAGVAAPPGEQSQDQPPVKEVQMSEGKSVSELCRSHRWLHPS